MNKRIQKKLHKRVFGPDSSPTWSLSKSESKYINLFWARIRSRDHETRQLQEQSRRKVEQEKKERKKLSDGRTTAIANKLIDVELKIREVFENV